MKIGVLALQGAFLEHIQVIHRLGAAAVEVRLPSDLENLDGLIIPGGESTTILKLMHTNNLFEPLRKMIVSGLPVLGTCAGMICLAKKISNSQQSILEPLALMDIDVKRNAFGRQVDSFEVDLPVPVLGDKPYRAVFIRAPLIEKVGQGVEVLARLDDGTIVAARQDNMLVTSFHPELTEDLRFHRYFLNMADSGR
ncbi:MAG: pyridoxal 5'-phosphate synthase glutaminase subunit PdxT [Dehalococcoidales bacterium]|jgi:5'-phosphate synthase pdxT subunit|nr:pyridoxal 5'-phosphate synthase glutaminase subunit PdxT [Dehalococcoidales bacterium]